jgi:hypothetical protein
MKFQCIKGCLQGISIFDIINVTMILLAFVNVGLKYVYDYLVWANISEGVRESAKEETDSGKKD